MLTTQKWLTTQLAGALPSTLAHVGCLPRCHHPLYIGQQPVVKDLSCFSTSHPVPLASWSQDLKHVLLYRKWIKCIPKGVSS